MKRKSFLKSLLGVFCLGSVAKAVAESGNSTVIAKGLMSKEFPGIRTAYVTDKFSGSGWRHGDYYDYMKEENIYPCDEHLYGDLAGRQVRHHKFPDPEQLPAKSDDQTWADYIDKHAPVCPEGCICWIGVGGQYMVMHKSVADKMSPEQMEQYTRPGREWVLNQIKNK